MILLLFVSMIGYTYTIFKNTFNLAQLFIYLKKPQVHLTENPIPYIRLTVVH